jgi:hypothetical protein
MDIVLFVLSSLYHRTSKSGCILHQVERWKKVFIWQVFWCNSIINHIVCKTLVKPALVSFENDIQPHNSNFFHKIVLKDKGKGKGP